MVANGAALQLEGNITVAGEPLQVQGTGLAETQSLNLSGATPGTTNFDLTFNKATTAILTYTGTSADATNIQSALDALSTIGGLTPNPGSVTVTQVQPGLFTLTFGGSLASASQPPLSITVVGGTGNATVLTNLNAPMVASGQNVTQLQTLTISGATAGTQYTLSFNGATTGKLTYTGSAADATTIQKALDALSTVGGVSGTVTVTFIQPGTYSIIFGGDLIDSEQPLITGVVVTGTGNVSNLTNLNAQLDWSAVGPAPVQSDTQVTAGAATTVAGRVTGIAVDPSDADTIYVSTAGGGAWRTEDGGQSWTQLFDAPGVMFSGAIAIAPNDPTVIYLGTGEADNSTDSYYGTGVFVSTNSGQTWSLLTSANGANPLFGLTVSKIAVDPQNPKLIYVASGDLAENTPTTAGTPGVYRYDGTNWTDLTSAASVTKFPQTKINWSDVALAINGSGVATALYAALGTPSGSAGGAFVQNGVYELTSQGTVGTNTNWTQNLVPAAGTDFGNVKIAVDGAALVAGVPATVLYAIAANTSSGLQELEKSTNGGTTWSAVTLPAGALGSLTEYALSIVMLQDTGADTVYVGGEEASSATHLQMIYGTTNGGTNWTDLSVDSAKNNPATNVHGMALDSNDNLDVGTDGGVWQAATGGASPTDDWSDLNGNLANSQVLGLAVNPTNPDNIIAGTEEDGVAEYSGNQTWTWLNTNAGNYGAGTVLMDASDPQTILVADSDSVLVGLIEESTNGGTSFSQIGPALQPGFAGEYPYFPLVVDPNNPSRIVFGGNFPSSVLEQSVDGGVTWTNLGTNLPLFYPSVTSIAIAGDQGTFQADPSFPLVTDIGANNYDPNTMYVTNGSTIYLTKNDGTSWVNRTSNLPAGIQISDLVVDPTNEYTAYVVTSNPSGSGIGRVYMTTNGGQKWTNISDNLPDVPTWTLTIDPRTKAGSGDGTLYVGNDDGVYELANGGSTWQRFGEGLPNVQVRTIQLNQAANTLTVGTYGRGVYQFTLDNVQINNSALLSVSGSPVWTGDVILEGNTTISSGGTQILQNGTSTTQLTLTGTISDAVDAAGNEITKIGQGNLILSGTNVYSGLTDIQAGVVTVRNPAALGETSAGTIIENGTALELQSSLNAEPLTVNGNGYQFNGHNTGAIRNLSGNNTYAGDITMNTNITIGTDSGTTLTINSPGAIIDDGNNYSLTKEEAGTLVLNTADTYAGGTSVIQGALEITNAGGLGSAAASVTNGAQIQIAGGINVANNVTLSGAGVLGTGALEDVGGNDTWSGTITLASIQGLATNPVPPSSVSIGSSTSGNVLTIPNPIGQTGVALLASPRSVPALSCCKPATPTRANHRQCRHPRVQNKGSLGAGTSTVVDNGGTLQLDGDPTAVAPASASRRPWPSLSTAPALPPSRP